MNLSFLFLFYTSFCILKGGANFILQPKRCIPILMLSFNYVRLGFEVVEDKILFLQV